MLRTFCLNICASTEGRLESGAFYPTWSMCSRFLPVWSSRVRRPCKSPCGYIRFFHLSEDEETTTESTMRLLLTEMTSHDTMRKLRLLRPSGWADSFSIPGYISSIPNTSINGRNPGAYWGYPETLMRLRYTIVRMNGAENASSPGLITLAGFKEDG
ncbi:hypothetical protein FISHEDRAFT_70212 [Fistulina hepatica ATCC 64428]|uniref:Uncharacterized protein n=1 Tax=Fistulina hepatica ATCC 64428 TaxID=1128425 RepID=A0A0D7AKZ5_9AGAR|nr:hypothetical protein FISHEDRAFT_70212 [Fistulina hepatica ATCC 64428]